MAAAAASLELRGSRRWEHPAPDMSTLLVALGLALLGCAAAEPRQRASRLLVETVGEQGQVSVAWSLPSSDSQSPDLPLDEPPLVSPPSFLALLLFSPPSPTSRRLHRTMGEVARLQGGLPPPIG